MHTRGGPGSIPAAVQAWRMVAPAATRSTATAKIGPSCPCKPSDVLRPVCKALLPLWRGPYGQVARRKGQQGRTARRRFRRHVVTPDRDQFPERAAKDQITLGAAVVLQRSGKPCGDLGCGGHCPSPVARGASTSTRDAMPASMPGLLNERGIPMATLARLRSSPAISDAPRKHARRNAFRRYATTGISTMSTAPTALRP